jgi:hypothetical protein
MFRLEQHGALERARVDSSHRERRQTFNPPLDAVAIPCMTAIKASLNLLVAFLHGM